jgi:hypothetical protein
MAAESVKTISSWLARHCAQPANAETASRYARIRVGRQRNVASQVWKEPLDGKNPDDVAKLVWTRIDSVAPPDRAWLEVMEVGGKSPVDTLFLGSGDEAESAADGLGSVLGDAAGTDPVIVALVNAIVQTNSQLSADIRQKNDQLLDLATRWVTAVGDGAGDKALLAYIERFGVPGQGGDEGDMIAAVKELVPILGPAIAAFTAGANAKSKSKKEPETPGAAWNRQVTELEESWRAHPDVLIADLGLLVRLRAIGEEVGAKASAAYSSNTQKEG